MTDVGTLMQYLFQGDLLGFFQAIYVSAFQSADLFWAMMIVLFTMPMYIRTRSLMLLCILWILLGGFVIVAMPLVGGIAMFLMICGIAGLLWKLYLSIHS